MVHFDPIPTPREHRSTAVCAVESHHCYLSFEIQLAKIWKWPTFWPRWPLSPPPGVTQDQIFWCYGITPLLAFIWDTTCHKLEMIYFLTPLSSVPNPRGDQGAYFFVLCNHISTIFHLRYNLETNIFWPPMNSAPPPWGMTQGRN